MKNLLELIERFGSNNEELKALKKLTDADNAEIKKIFAESGLDSVESENFNAQYSITKSESFNEKLLLEKLKELGATYLIKTVEVVDMDLLENALYNGELAGKDLVDCKVTKETPRLTVKLKKKGKKDGNN